MSDSLRCDGYTDCQDRSDEDGCVPQVECAADQYRCKNSQQCVLQEWICDGENDCKDMSDEQVTLMFQLSWGTVEVLPSMRGGDCMLVQNSSCLCRTVRSLQCSVGSFSGHVRLRLSAFLRAGTATAPETVETRAMRLDVSQSCILFTVQQSNPETTSKSTPV